ncbi:MAG: GNAT family N-acetyltransferase [Oscillospiraceae bacterium]|nr:GNAT family N-acetyltransferase [Oscillospiraceae bacterium]
MNIRYVEDIPFQDYMRLHEEVGWGVVPEEQAKMTVANATFVISARKEDGTVIGISRLLWDGGTTAYICDVIVSPAFQAMGIGRELVARVMEHMKKNIRPGWSVFVALVAAPDRERFYEHFGFIRRPNEQQGSGMSLYLVGK